jgi:hypothetical protein
MGPKAIEFHQQEAKRACPFVMLHPDNKVASDIVWLGLSDRLHFLSYDYITTQLRNVRPSEKIKVYSRAVEALNSEAVVRFMQKAQAQARSQAGGPKPSGSLQSRRRSRRPVRRH